MVQDIGKNTTPKQGMSYDTMLKKKRAVVHIKNKDELCCAIVAIKAKVDQDLHYPNIRKGCLIPGKLGKQLHQDAGIPEGPCGLEKLKELQQYLAPEYQVIMIEGLKGEIISIECQYDTAPKTIILLKAGNHYHSITSIPGFLNRSYFCCHCEKSYNTEDASYHNCIGQIALPEYVCNAIY